MIVYFSGTGNSRDVARRLGQSLEEEVVSITASDPSTLKMTGRSFGIVCPVYAWGIPPIVGSFIRRLPDDFIRKLSETEVWSVLTCGDETGKAPDMLRKMLGKRGLKPSGIWSVIMPNVYLLLPGFSLDPAELEQQKINLSVRRVNEIAGAIKKREFEEDCLEGSAAWIKTKVVYPLFEKMGVVPSRWYASDVCIGCGKCVRNCPVGNIRLVDRHPKWGKDCTSCMACYHGCPVSAIDYGKITRGKGQYRRFLK